jgi:hypothetical protein
LALAQMTRGSIRGRVTDASGAPIPSATVTIQNQATGETRTLNTNEKGFYNAPSLLSGRYNATSAHTGFGDLVKNNLVKNNLVVDVGEQLVVDFQLKVGASRARWIVSTETQGITLGSSAMSDGRASRARSVSQRTRLNAAGSARTGHPHH